MGYVLRKTSGKISGLIRPRMVMKVKKAEEVYKCCNNKVSKILHKNIWSGRRCFILGGGESLKGRYACKRLCKR